MQTETFEEYAQDTQIYWEWCKNYTYKDWNLATAKGQRVYTSLQRVAAM